MPRKKPVPNIKTATTSLKDLLDITSELADASGALMTTFHTAYTWALAVNTDEAMSDAQRGRLMQQQATDYSIAYSAIDIIERACQAVHSAWDEYDTMTSEDGDVNDDDKSD